MSVLNINISAGFISIFMVAFALPCPAATAMDPTDTILSSRHIVEAFENYQSNNYRETIYCHTNRNDFLTGEAMWFTAWCLDASSLTFSSLSKTLYVELIDRQGNAVMRHKLPLQDGSAHGSIYLPSSLQSDCYLLRAYTAWMKNRSPENFFQQNVRIVNPFRKLNLSSTDFSKGPILKFFPEGGRLVTGLESVVVCQTQGTEGAPEPLTVQIINQSGEVMKIFKTDNNGIGTFEFLPGIKESYRAMTIGSDSSVSWHSFPEIDQDGSVLQVSKNKKGDILIHLQVTGQLSEPRLIVMHNRNAIVLAETFTPSNGHIRLELEADRLAEGIYNIAVFTTTGSIQCQRLIYNQKEDSTNLTAVADKSVYKPREDINIDAAFTSGGKPAEGATLSISVYPEHKSWFQPGKGISEYLNYRIDASLIELQEMPGYAEKLPADYLDRILICGRWKSAGWQELFDADKSLAHYLPEFRGHLIIGQVQGAITGDPIVNQFVYLSVPGPNPQTYVSRSDRNGRIRFEALDFYGSKQVVALPQDTAAAYEIRLDEPFADLRVPDLPQLNLDSSFAEILLKHSLAMQVQNAYNDRANAQLAQIKPDTMPFYGVADEIYYLDDFTRFTVMEEVFREYIRGVLVRRRNGKFIFRVIEPGENTIFQEDPLVLLDGIPVFDVDKIMAFDPLKIKKIEVVTREYYKGEKTFKGIVSMFTYEGDLAGFVLNPAARIISYSGLHMAREFQIPDISARTNRSEPDYRTQLYWCSGLKTDKNGHVNFTFPASDVTGSYTVDIQSLSPTGQYVTKRLRIHVE